MVNRNYDQCFLCECNAEVKEVVQDREFYWHALDQTIFFVESGGMKSDIGTINSLPVLGLKIENHKVWHLLEKKLEGHVFLSVNMHHRFRNAQIHTTQHLIAALIQGVYGAKKISHHVGEDENQIEFDLKTFSNKQCSELQILANGLIRDDLPITISYPSKAEVMKNVPKEKCNYDEMRIVRIGTLDYNPCGCIHVPSLKYIQMIKIIGYEKTPRGIKIIYNCGDQLLDSYERRLKVLDEASHTLALPHLYINSGINKIINDRKNLNVELVEMKNRYYEVLADELAKRYPQKKVVHVFDGFEAKDLHQFTLAFAHQHQKITCFVTLLSEGRYFLAVSHDSSIDFDAGEFVNELKERVDFHGGGSKISAQGGGKFSDELIAYLNEKLS